MLTINGTGFVNSSVVRWNASDRATTYVSSTQLTAAITAADIATPSTASVTVLNPAPGGGTSNAVSFAVGNPVPIITGLSPFWATPSGLDFTLTVNGMGFVNGSVVRWGGSNRTTVYVGSTQLTAQISSADITTPGIVIVTVLNPAPGGGPSNTVSFLVGTPKKIYLPLVGKNYQPPPAAPVLNAIANAAGDAIYTVSWNTAARAASYTLEEDDNIDFSTPTTLYTGTGLSWSVGKLAGTYYYRVNAGNTLGSSGWSNAASTTVRPGCQNTIQNPGFEGGTANWQEFSTHGLDIIINSGFPGTVLPHGGSWAAWEGGADSDASYVQQNVSVSCPYLVYWHWIASQDDCGYDFAGVVVNGTVVDVYDLCLTNNTGGWVKHVVNLGAYVGQTVQLQIRTETDSSANSNLFVDDVTLQSTAAAAAEVTRTPSAADWQMKSTQFAPRPGATPAGSPERLFGQASSSAR